MAQAVNYLHAKSIVARCSLTTRSIYLEPKVKISLLDHVVADATIGTATSGFDCSRYVYQTFSRYSKYVEAHETEFSVLLSVNVD